MNHFRLITCLLFSIANPFSELIAMDEETNILDQVSSSDIDGGEVSNAVEQEEQKRDIRIQFEGVPYTDALQRFSQMANKPLIVESSLEGTLTFFDPEPYSYREALDVLNVILSMKGVALVENGRFLQLTKLENLKKLPLKVLRGSDASGDVRPGQIVTFVIQLQHLDAAEVSTAATSLLTSAGSIAPLSRGKGLIITDRLESIQRIRQLLAEIDVGASAERLMKTHSLKHSSGAVVAELINKTFGKSSAPKRLKFNDKTKRYDSFDPEPATYVTAVYDEASRTMVLFGPSEQVELASTLLLQFETGEGKAGDVKIFHPAKLTAEELAAMIREGVEGVAQKGDTSESAKLKARIIVDSKLNRIIASAPVSGQLELIEKFVLQVDGTGSAGGPRKSSSTVNITRVYRIKSLDLEILSKAVENATSDIFPSGDPRPRLAISKDDSTRSLIVTGSPGDVDTAETIIRQLEIGLKEPIAEPRTTEMLPLVNHRVDRIYRNIESLVNERMSEVPFKEQPKPRMIQDRENNRVIVTANSRQHQVVEQVVKSLDVLPLIPSRTMRFVDLEGAEARKVTPLINRLFENDKPSEGPSPQIVEDTGGKRLIVLSTENQHERIMAFLDEYGSTSSLVLEREIRSISLPRRERGKFNEMVQSIQKLIDQRMQEVKFARMPRPLILPDEPGSRMVLTATEEQFLVIDQIVATVTQTPEPAKREMRVLRLKDRNGQELAELTKRLFEKQISTDGSRPQIFSDKDGTRLVVVGTELEYKQIEAFAQDFNEGRMDLGPHQFKFVDVPVGQAAEIVKSVGKLYEDQLRDNPERQANAATILADSDDDRVVISGPQKEVGRVEGLVRMLGPSTGKSGGQKVTQVIRLNSANAQNMSGLIEKSFNAGSNRGKVTLLVDDSSNSLILSGAEKSVAAAEGVIRQLDSDNRKQPLELRILELRAGEASKVGPLATELFTALMKDRKGSSYKPRSTITVDDSANRIIITGNKDEIDEIDKLVKQLDSTTRQSAGNRIFKVKSADAKKISEIINRTFVTTDYRGRVIQRVSVAADEVSNLLIVAGKPEDLLAVGMIVEQLDVGNPIQPKDIKVVELPNEEGESISKLASQVWGAQMRGVEGSTNVSFNHEPSGKRLIIVAPSGMIKQAEDVVSGLLVSPESSKREVVVVELDQGDATILVPVLVSAYQAKVEGLPGNPATILNGASDKQVVVMGTPAQITEIREMVSDLETPENIESDRVSRIIELGDISEVERLQPLVEQVYLDRYKDNVQEPADAQIISDPSAVSLIVSGAKDHVKAIEEIIAELRLKNSKPRPRITRVYDLKNTEAATLAPTVTQLYTEKLKDTPGADLDQALVLADATANRLIVMAPDDEFEVLEELINQLDKVSLQPAGTRVFKLKANDPVQVASILTGAIPGLSATPDLKSNSLVASGTPENLQTASVIIEQLDNVADKPDREVKVFTLSNSKAEATATQSMEVYMDQMKGKSELGDSDAMIIADPIGDRLIVTANTLQFSLIKGVIDTLDQEAVVGDRKTVVYPLKNGSAASMMSVIANVFSAELELADNNMKLSVTSSVDDKSLVVSGQQEDLAKVEELIIKLDAPTFSGEVEVRSYRLMEGDTGDLAEALNKIFESPDGSPSGAIQPKFEADEDTKHLLVAATQDQFQKIEKLIEDFQAAAEVTHGIKTFRLVRGESEDIANVLREMLGADDASSSSSSSRSSSYYRYRYGRSSSQQAKAKVTSAKAINAVIVQGTPSQLSMAEELVETLDQMERPEASVMEVVHLEKAEAASVADAVNRALQGGDSARSSSSRSRSSSSSDEASEVTVTPEVNSNSLLIVGPVELVKTVTELVRQLDIKGETEGGVDIKIYKLENGEVKSVGQTLEDMIERVLMLMPGSSEDRSRRRYQVRVWGDEPTKTLFVLVPPRQTALVEKLLPLLDQKTEEALQSGELKVYPIEHARASRLGIVLEDIIDRMAQLAPGTEEERRARMYSVRFWSHEDSNILMAVVPPDLQALTERLIKMLDTSSEVQEQLGEIQLFPLKFGDAEEVANMLEDMVERLFYLNPRPGLTTSQMARLVRIWPHGDTNSIFVLVPPDQIPIVKNLIGMLDVKPEDAVENAQIQLFKLEHTEAEAVGEILESMVEQVLTLNPKSKINSRQIKDLVEIWPNLETNSLFVLVPKEQLPMVTNLLSMLDAKPERVPRQIHYVLLENADAVTVSEQIIQLFGELDETKQPIITADLFTNSITLIATAEQITEIDEVISSLDEAAVDKTLQIRVISSEGVPARDLAETLTGFYSKLSGVTIKLVDELPGVNDNDQNNQKDPADDDGIIYIAVDEKINAILASGKSNELDRVSRIVDDLNYTIIESDAEFRTYELKEADPEGLAKAILDIYSRPEKTVIEDGKPKKVPQPPKVVAVPDLRTRSVIIRAEALDFEYIDVLVENLDKPSLSQIDMKFFELRNAKPEDAVEYLQEYFEELKVTSPGEILDVRPDTRTESVVVLARPDMFDQISKIIERIDVPPAFAEADVEIIELRKANAQNLAEIMQTMIRADASEGGLTEEAQNLVEQIQKLNLTNNEGQPIQLDLTQPIKIFGESSDGINRLIVTSTPDNMIALKAFVSLMDSVSVIDGVTVRVVALSHANAEDVRDTLENIFSQSQSLGEGPGGKAEPEGSGGKALVDQLNFGVDDRSNSIIMSGSPDSVDLAEKLISDLDKDVENFVTDVKVFKLKHASTDQVLPMLQSVFNEDSNDPSREGISRQVTRLRLYMEEEGIIVSDAPAARDALSIQGDDRSNTLIVAARSDLLPLIEEVISTLDIPSVGGMEAIQIYPLDHANAATIQNIIENLYEGQSREQVRQEDRPNIVVDGRTNALIIAANSKTLAIVNSLIQRLDTKMDNPGIKVEVVPLVHNDSSQVAGMINDVFAARRRNMAQPGEPSQPQERVNVESDGLTNSLIVTASNENLELIRELVSKVDIEPTAETSQLTIIPLKFADAQRAAAMLRSLVKQGLYRPGTTRSSIARASRESIAISVDHATNTLIISASPENLAVVREVVNQIDTENYARSGALKLYQLKHASATRLASTIETFFKSKRTAEASVGDLDAVVPVAVTPDERTNTLLVTGGKESFSIIDQLLEKLDADAVVAQNQYEVISLNNGSATKLKTMLDRLFAGRTTPPGGQAPLPVTIIADSISNALVIGAATEDLPMVRDLVQRLDSEQTDPDINVAVLSLSKANATSVSQIIQGLYRDVGATSGPSVAISVDERINALVVSAGENDLKRIQELAKQLDTDEVSRVSEIRVFALKHASSTDLALLLNTALNTKPQNLTSQSADRQELLQFITRTVEDNELVTTGLREGVLITPDPRTNSLVVSAPVDNMELIEQVINKLDSSSPQIAQIKVFQLDNADAVRMAEVLTNLFRLEAAGGEANSRSIRYTLVKPSNPSIEGTDEPTIGTAEQNALTVTVDIRTNSLLVGGSEHYVSLAIQIITELDSSPAQERITKVYRLKNAQAEEIALALTTFLDQARQRIQAVLGTEAVGTAQRLLDEEVAIVAEPTNNALLVSASPRYFEQVSEMIDQLDQPQRQVLIQVLLAEVTLDGNSDQGIDWAVSRDFIPDASFPGDEGGNDFSAGSNFGSDSGSALGGLTATITNGDIDFILRAMQSDGKLEILSRPQILAADNQAASIDIGQRVPFVTGSSYNERGNLVNAFSYEQVGVQLNVTPRISPDGLVKLDVEPTISSLSSSSVPISAGFDAPVINNRSASTMVSVQDGQTVVMGGLISTQDNVRETKIPLLGDIPYLGVAFKRTKKTRKRTELLIIMTPQIIETPEEIEKFSRESIENSTFMRPFNESGTKRNETQIRILDSIDPKARKEKGVTVPKSSPNKLRDKI
ncbi:MAG: secretin N-terminal domain-containing protein [Verrucomicrobiota bacterium]|nr:secretin N-terminal domain-containing protein [Verrucomicrobiota bacterium]